MSGPTLRKALLDQEKKSGKISRSGKKHDIKKYHHDLPNHATHGK